MVQIFIIFLIIILLLAAILGAAVAFRSRNVSSGSDFPVSPDLKEDADGDADSDDLDSQYYDDSGNHIYYDRSRIEKEEFIRRHPDEKPRSLSRLFKWK